MSFKLKGGHPVKHSKWALNPSTSTWESLGDDCNGGQLIQSVQPQDDGTALARVIHRGYAKFSDELVELVSLEQDHRNVDLAKGWCRKTANGLAYKHDRLIELNPDDYRFLASQTTSEGLAPGNPEDFGPNRKPVERFRSRRRRK